MSGTLSTPYFFQPNVNGKSYRNFTDNELQILRENVDLTTRYRMCLLQDGAQPHYAR